MKERAGSLRLMRRLPAILALLAGAAMLNSLGVGGCRGTNLLSTKEEVRLGRQAAAEVERRYKVVKNTPQAARVASIGARIIEHCDQREGVPYFVKLLDVDQVNAVSLPGGPLYVYTGLLDFLGADDDALACIIGHEVGHIDARHAAKQMSQQLVANLGISILIRGRTEQDIAALTSELLNLSYSREDEHEADHRGVSYAHKAGYKATGMLHFFKKLAEQEKGGARDPELLRTHPYASARMARVERIIERQDYRYGR